MKINQRSFLSLFVLICALFVGCNNPVLHNRPSDQACKAWLDGKKITLEEGILFKPYWPIRKEEFSSFAITSVTQNSDGSSTASLTFELTSVDRILRVEGQIVYRHHKADDVIEFMSFTPTRLLKLGKW